MGYLAMQFNELKEEVEKEVESSNSPAEATAYSSESLKSEVILAGHPDDLITVLTNPKLRSEWDPLCFSAKKVSEKELICKYHNLSGGVTEQTLKYICQKKSSNKYLVLEEVTEAKKDPSYRVCEVSKIVGKPTILRLCFFGTSEGETQATRGPDYLKNYLANLRLKINISDSA